MFVCFFFGIIENNWQKFICFQVIFYYFYSSSITTKSFNDQVRDEELSRKNLLQSQTAKLGSVSFYHSKSANKNLNKTKSQRYSNDNKLLQKPPKYSITNNFLGKSDLTDEMQPIQDTVPRSRSDLHIVKVLNKNFNYSRNLSAYSPDNVNDDPTSKSPSLNSILDSQMSNEPTTTVITRSSKIRNNKVYRGSDYTDSGIGHENHSHRSSIISQGSNDSGTSSIINNNNNLSKCNNYMRDLSSANTSSK